MFRFLQNFLRKNLWSRWRCETWISFSPQKTFSSAKLGSARKMAKRNESKWSILEQLVFVVWYEKVPCYLLGKKFWHIETSNESLVTLAAKVVARLICNVRDISFLAGENSPRCRRRKTEKKKGIEKRKKREYKTSLTFDVAAVRPFHVNPAQKFRSGTSNFQAAPPRRSRRVTREKIISMRNATLEHASPFIRPEWRGAGGGSAFRADVARVSRVRVRGIDERNLVAAVTQEKGKEGNERKTQLDVLVRLFSPWFAVFRNHGTKQNTYVPRSIFNKTIGWPLFCCRCQTERAHGQATRVVIAEAKGRIYERVKSAVWRAKNYFPCVRPVSRCSCAQRALCRAYVRR